MGEDGSDLDFARAGSALPALTAPEFTAAHRGTGAVGADAKDVAGGGVEDRSLSLTPPLHSQDVGCPFEMVGIVGQPELMALYFSRLATLRFITEVLARAITQFREE